MRFGQYVFLYLDRDVFHLIKEIWTYTPQFTYTLDSVMYKLKVDKSYKHSRNTRHPKTIQELRFNCAHNKYIRGKRHNLPTWCDELPVKIIHSKSWKNRTKHKKQWMQRYVQNSKTSWVMEY